MRTKSRGQVRRLQTRMVLATALFGLLGCSGPDGQPPSVPLAIPDQAKLLPQLNDGPRHDNAQRELERHASRVSQGLFQPQPMQPTLAPNAPRAVTAEPEVAHAERPAWADGVERPANAGDSDVPQSWPLEVRRGETPALLSEWSGQVAADILSANQEALGGRKWLKIGDRITITMSAGRKVAFDRLRDRFQRDRIEGYFATKYFKEVVVYRVKRGEFIASAAKRYGDVPLWLIEEFNQADFRSLQPGDEILIPVVAELPEGVRQPPPLRVVDESGHPLADADINALNRKIPNDFISRARMALDDSNVFMRGGAMRPETANPSQYPAARIGSTPSQTGPMPGIEVEPARPAYAASSAYVPVNPATSTDAPVNAPVEASTGGIARDVVVKRGESLMHYVRWSGQPLDRIKTANPHLDPDRIFVGARISIPMSDEQYVIFVQSRAAWETERVAQQAEKAKQDKIAKVHTVASGETATSIARSYRITVKQLRDANPRIDLSRLRSGTKLDIPKK